MIDLMLLCMLYNFSIIFKILHCKPGSIQKRIWFSFLISHLTYLRMALCSKCLLWFLIQLLTQTLKQPWCWPDEPHICCSQKTAWAWLEASCSLFSHNFITILQYDSYVWTLEVNQGIKLQSMQLLLISLQLFHFFSNTIISSRQFLNLQGTSWRCSLFT